MDSLIEELPRILERGKKEAQRVLDGLSAPNRIILQTNELVLPTKAKGGLSTFFGQPTKQLAKEGWLNRMIYGDNLLVMQALLAGDSSTGMPSLRDKVDLIYIDPPFDSKADYRTRVHLPSGDIEQRPAVIEQFAYSDTWKNGTASYLEMIVPRLVLMRELLSNRGSLYVHIDWHVGHYVKVILDDIFGRENFVNEIVWKRTGAHNDPERYGVIHDSILFYAKSLNYWSETQYTPYTEEYIHERFRTVEVRTNRKYWLNTMTAPSHGRAAGPAVFFGVERMPPPGTMWRFTQDGIDELVKQGKIVTTKSGMPYIKQYLDESLGRAVQSIWDDLVPSKSGDERLDYATQKPEELLKRIIKASCPKDGIVADFFAGSGTTAAAAEHEEMKWIIADIGKPAIMISRKRLIDQDSNPFLYQSIGDYQKEQFEQSMFKTFGDLAQVVVNLFGAVPFPSQEGVPTNLGYLKPTKTLVFVDSPNKLTGYATLRKAQQLRSSFMGGWNKVIVLGWNFVTDIGKVIQSINDKNLEVLVIPPDLLDKLRTKANYEQLIKTGEIRFSSLQYVTIKPIKKTQGDSGDILEVELDNYVLLSPDALPLDEDNKKKLERVIENDPLSLIEYWSIDPEYDGATFRSMWQDYRENNEDFRIKRFAKIATPKMKEKRKVCVKVVDVLGSKALQFERLADAQTQWEAHRREHAA